MTTKLYVGNLSYSSTEESLRSALSSAGHTASKITVVTDRATGRSRGFAFVEIESDEEANAAIAALNGRELDGRTLKVSVARERSQDREGGRGEGFGDRGGGDDDRDRGRGRRERGDH